MNYIADWPADQYHSVKDRISKHGLDLIHRAPALYKHNLTATKERTAAMRWGSLVHTFVLEPDQFDAVVGPQADKRTKEGKAAWEQFTAENQGKEVIKQEELDELESVRKAISAHGLGSQLIQSGSVEMSLFWTHGSTGLKCKARPDLVREDGIIVDLKTCADASSKQFAKDAYKYRYHVQAAFYLDAAAAVGIEADTFVFLCVEKDAPHLVQCFECDEALIEMGRKEYLEDLAVYKQCVETGLWPGYDEGIQTLSLPNWVK
jgi:hypothetical protein